MRLLHLNNDGEYSLTQFFDNIPSYAILSHTWGPDEVTFKDMIEGNGASKTGFDKIRFCGEQARRDGWQYFWVDTCCIDKSNAVELQEAINSMFRWYQNAAQCYVYLSDVSMRKRRASDEFSELPWESIFRGSRWFTRGWTLQELLAPRSVEFFCREGRCLGNKDSLKHQIERITGIPILALQGAPLSRFSVDQRFAWMERRQTTLEVDKVYALLGILDVKLPLFKDTEATAAFRRLREVISKREKCIQDVRVTDPRHDKKRIENTKGGLLEDAYRWIIENPEFIQWRDCQMRTLLWIKGDPGKGKTMLACGIIDELSKSKPDKALLSYFFCQATDSRINSAPAVLRGLIYLLVSHQPSLASHIQKMYDSSGKKLFEDPNAWFALSEIFTDVLQDPNLGGVYFIVDGLDECVTGLPSLLDLIVKTASCRIKWIVTSRNWPEIEEGLVTTSQSLSLELNAASVSAAVSIFIKHRVSELASRKKYNDKIRLEVLEHLSAHANGTFLWVALVCQDLEKIPKLAIPARLRDFPPGLDALYERMMERIRNSDCTDLCNRVLASIAIVYRPITLTELTTFIDEYDGVPDDVESLQEIIGRCGSFLTVREDTIYFVHQSAKDYLLTKATEEIFPAGKEKAHHHVFSRSLKVMSSTLRRDIYRLRAPGFPIDQVKQPDSDPLAVVRYSCLYWGDHLIDYSRGNEFQDLQNGGLVDCFLRKYYLYWFEALSLMKSLSDGIVMIIKLENWLQVSYSILKV
jgi:hypothetical protein